MNISRICQEYTGDSTLWEEANVSVTYTDRKIQGIIRCGEKRMNLSRI
jgi:hypothetical protein